MAISISGTTLTFNDNTTQTTAATGTVSSVATGNGLSGGTITTTGTLSVACPSFNTVGSYCFVGTGSASSGAFVAGSNYSAGSGTNQFQTSYWGNNTAGFVRNAGLISGTWKWMSGSNADNSTDIFGIACRVS